MRSRHGFAALLRSPAPPPSKRGGSTTVPGHELMRALARAQRVVEDGQRSPGPVDLARTIADDLPARRFAALERPPRAELPGLFDEDVDDAWRVDAPPPAAPTPPRARPWKLAAALAVATVVGLGAEVALALLAATLLAGGHARPW